MKGVDLGVSLVCVVTAPCRLTITGVGLASTSGVRVLANPDGSGTCDSAATAAAASMFARDPVTDRAVPSTHASTEQARLGKEQRGLPYTL